MSNASAPYPSEVMEELHTNLLRVQAQQSAERFWERILTDQERELLGGNLCQAYEHGGTVGMWMRLRGVSQPRAIVDLAYALNFITEATSRWLLREIGELHDTIEEAMAAVVASGALVLVEQERLAYWSGRQICVNWHNYPALWNFFWVLCERAKSRGGVDHTHFAEGVQPDYPSKTKSRLCQMEEFPVDLGDLIRPEGRGTQRLHLPPDRIHLFAVTTTEVLREVTG